MFTNRGAFSRKVSINDAQKKKIVRVEEKMAKKYESEMISVFNELEIPKLNAPQNFEETILYEVKRRDIDIIGHMHNIYYLDLAYEALGDLISVKDVQNTINEQKIFNCVAFYYNLSVSQITGKLKTGQIVIARHIAIYLIRNMLDVSLNKIGQIFSNRDHTTIMHSISAVDKMLKTKKKKKNVIDTLKAKISGK